MEEEIKIIDKNQIWNLVNLPKGKYIIGVKSVYKTKLHCKDQFKNKRRE